MNNYIKPTTTVMAIAAQQMMAGSLNPTAGTGSVTEEMVTSGTAGESKGGFLWDDDE